MAESFRRNYRHWDKQSYLRVTLSQPPPLSPFFLISEPLDAALPSSGLPNNHANVKESMWALTVTSFETDEPLLPRKGSNKEPSLLDLLGLILEIEPATVMHLSQEIVHVHKLHKARTDIEGEEWKRNRNHTGGIHHLHCLRILYF